MIALSDNPSIPHSGAHDYYPENMSKITAFTIYKKNGDFSLFVKKSETVLCWYSEQPIIVTYVAFFIKASPESVFNSAKSFFSQYRLGNCFQKNNI